MNRLFKRQVELTVAKPDGFFLQLGVNALVIRDLRVQFQIERHLGAEPNTCDVTVSNLAEHSRAGFQVKPLVVRLAAGYDGQVEGLFTGDVVWATSTHDGTDWETSLQLADGGRAYRHARVLRSWRGGVDALTALREAASAMGLLVRLSPQATNVLRGQFASGLTVSGPASTVVTQILRPLDLTWSIQDGRLQVLGVSEVRAEQATVVSQDSGMIGVPQWGAPERKKGKPVLTLKTLLKPGLVPGGRIVVQSRDVEGTFKLQRVVHTGDTHGTDWFSDIEAVSL